MHLHTLYRTSLPISFSGETPALYTVLPEKSANVGSAMMGSSHIYDLSAVRHNTYTRAHTHTHTCTHTHTLTHTHIHTHTHTHTQTHTHTDTDTDTDTHTHTQ